MIVVVEWDDASADVGWESDKMSLLSVTSVGFLVHKDKQKVILAGMTGTTGYNCRQAIPRGCITSIRRIDGSNRT